MELFMIIAMGISGSYLIMLAFLMTTKNLSSMFLFKFIPFILGLTSYFTCGKMWGII